MKKIRLNQGQHTLVDSPMYEYLNQWKWYARLNKHTKSFCVYRMEYLGKQDGRYKQKTVLMHRLIMNITDSKIQIDHKNHDTLDNRISNLRECNDMENHRNQKKHKNCSSKYKGVSFNKKNKKWVAYIRINKKLKYLGYFIKEIDAAKAYDKAAKKYFKKFAYLNFNKKE